jgi:outer membrane protein assembly factor BamB
LAALALSLISCLYAIERTSIYTNPSPLPREFLDRLNLKQAWITHVPMESKKDGIYSVQFPEIDVVRFASSGPVLIPQILVQTRSGLVVALNRDTGDVMWQSRPGRPYQALQPLAFNSRTVVQMVGLDAHAIDRFTGDHLWRKELPGGPIATPVADENQLYLALAEGKLHVYLMPDMDIYRDALEAERRKAEKDSAKGSAPVSRPTSGYGTATPSVGIGTESTRGLFLIEERGPKVASLWSTIDIYNVSGTPILTPTSWVVLGSKGTAAAYSRSEFKEHMRFRAGAPLLLAPGTYENMVYVASENQKLYALNIETGDASWEFSTGSGLAQPPFVSDEDVFGILDHKGLMRIDRRNGEAKWKAAVANVDRVLATNPKFVYALDRESRLMVLDRARGTELSRLESRDFPFPIVNEHDDRLFLAAHDGTIVCLHDKDYTTPRIMKNAKPDDGGSLNPLYGKLDQKININEPLTDKPLRTVLQYLDKQFKLPTLIRKEAFRDSAALEAFLEQPVTLPKVVESPLGQVLGTEVLEKIKARYSVRAGYVLIEPVKEVPKDPK